MGQVGFESSFQVETYGKWILAGEHSVIRGSEAVVFPLKSASLELKVSKDNLLSPLKVRSSGSKGHEYELLFHSIFQKACESLRVSAEDFKGIVVDLASNLPVGTGLGASAALCVAMTRFFQKLNLISEDQVYDFALKMENIFHGESSGVDIAVCLMGSGIVFQRGVKREPLHAKWSPPLYVSYSGQRGMTFDCVEKVKQMLSVNESKGRQIDAEMSSAVQIALEAFRLQDLSLLQKSLDVAHHCFMQWDLCPASMIQEMQKLKSSGALAVKPTGSGGGGFILSLWPERLNESQQRELQLMSCF